MPDGATHHKYWRLYLIPVIGVSTALAVVGSTWCILYRNDPLLASYILEFWLWFNVWYLSGRYVDPDWDQKGQTAAEGRATRELDLLGVLLFGYSSFYAALMDYLARKLKIKGMFGGSHRSELTHSFVGTFIRSVMVDMPLVYLLQLAYVLSGERFMIDSLDLIIFLLAQLAGMGLADAIHVQLDRKHGESYERTTRTV